MNSKDIKVIFFDVGATLRVVIEDAEYSYAAEEELMKLVGATMPHDEFVEMLTERWENYRQYSKKSLLDVSEMELWMHKLLPDYPPELTSKNAARLTRLWRNHDGRRDFRPGTVETIKELAKRGYKLGIIANTVTETEIPDWMVEYGVAHLFEATLLSSKVRIRKPDPAIYLLAARAAGVEPSDCAYVGDNPNRDVDGTIDAGYSVMVRIDDLDKPSKEKASKKHEPHYIIHEMKELLDIFPPKEGGLD
ncbi:MAG: HAD family hydrolase [Lachnospiraceae bacterium]|jgi:HAD superfamily hydrolase (TIGR01549 family)|nr:HAD family hydrolase [Lachnospiraceae bacterium]